MTALWQTSMMHDHSSPTATLSQLSLRYLSRSGRISAALGSAEDMRRPVTYPA